MHKTAIAWWHAPPRSRAVRLLLMAAGVVALTATAVTVPVAVAGTHPSREVAVPPTNDIVGTGLVDCAAATGEVGYSPASKAGATYTVSIWFVATKCSAAAGGATPVPKTVIGSMSFTATGCPLSGQFGTGTLNLTYNYPPVPNPMIDPSVAPNTTVTDGPPITPFWTLSGSVPAVTGGSYPDPAGTNFTISLKPNIIVAGQTCKTGITSEYIIRSNGPLTNI